MTEDTHTQFDFEQEFQPNNHRTKRRRWFLVGWFFVFVCAILLGGYWYLSHLNQPSPDFPLDTAITIESGTEVRAITEILAAEGVVRSSALLYYVLAFFYEPTNIKASTYVFDTPLTTFAVASRLSEGDFNTNLVRFTHIEGERASLLATRATDVLPDFDSAEFMRLASSSEGKLFPDTYFIPATYNEQELFTLLRDTYTERIEALRPLFETHTLTEDEVIVLASIVEREANTTESMRLVAGILQNRLAIGMALQADATIEYALETPLGELPPGVLAENLRELDSPYNTYLYANLPPTPIGNPGLEAIMAVLEPTDSDYFYYITDDSGQFYYAETFDQHRVNIERYLQ